MENRELMLRVAADLIALGNSIKALAGAEDKQEVPVKEQEAPVKEEQKKYTLTEVRAALAEKSGAGFTTEVRELLKKHGATKLSAIPEEQYEEIMNEVKEIG